MGSESRTARKKQMSGKSFAKPTPLAVPVRVVPASALAERENRLRERIARRAHELFERRGSVHGRDIDDWLQAEAELVRRFPHTVARTDHAFIVFAELPGAWEAGQLLVGVESRRLIITGEREVEVTYSDAKGTRTEKRAQSIFQSLDLPVDVDPSRTTASLAGMTLEVAMPQVPAETPA
jgi:HSP20 family molecular chaperone IbpA